MATLKDYRRHGVGSSMMRFIEKYARENDIPKLVLHAQMSVRDWYLNLGYKSVGKVFQEADIDHIKMTKEIKK